MAKKNWIPKNLKKCALRKTAKRLKSIKGKEKLSAKDLTILAKRAKKTGNTKLARRVSLAKTFRKMRKK